MALIELNVFSKKLEQITQISLVVPENFDRSKDKAIILLHGYIGNNKDWTRYSNVEDLANLYNVLLIMPSGHNSFYTNMEYGFDYFDFINDELKEIVNHYINFKFTKDNTYIAGLSMGGYGAMKIALTKPNLYRGVATLSGALDAKKAFKRFENKKIVRAVFGDEETFNKNLAIHDLYLLAKNNNLDDLDIYIGCGESDFLLKDSIEFSNYLNDLKINHQYNISPGDHTWPYWEKEILKVFKYFFK